MTHYGDPDHDPYAYPGGQAQEAMDDEFGAQFGDPRRCPRHPGQVTSSPDGMHDCPCGSCEMGMEDDRFDQPASVTPEELDLAHAEAVEDERRHGVWLEEQARQAVEDSNFVEPF